MQRLFIAAIWIISLLAAAHPSWAAIFVSGQVTSRNTSAPVPDATVTLTKAVPGSTTGPRATTAPNAPAIAVPQAPAVVRAGPRGNPTAPASPNTLTEHTLANGSFILKVPTPGNYHLTVDQPEFVPLERDLQITAAGLPTLHLTLDSPPTVRLQILGPDDQPAIAGQTSVWLVVTHKGGDPTTAGSWAQRTAGPGGRFDIPTSRTFKQEDAGQVGVFVRNPALGCARVLLHDWPRDTVPIHLAPAIPLTGIVVDEAGKPVAGNEVALNGMDPNLGIRFLQGWATATTSDDGKFQIPALLPGRYDLRSTLKGDKSYFHLTMLTANSQPVRLSPEDRTWPPSNFNQGGGEMPPTGNVEFVPNTPLDAPQGQPIIISGSLVDKSKNKPIPGMGLSLRLNRNGNWWNSPPDDVAQSGPDGKFSFQVASAGNYQLNSDYQEDADYSSLYRPLTVPAEGIKNLEISMSRRPKLQFRLTGPDGKALTTGSAHVAMMVQTDHGGYGFDQDATIQKDGVASVRLYNDVDTAAVSVINMVVRAPGIGAVHARLNKWPDDPAPLHLQPGYDLSGKVLGPDGTALSNVMVQAYWILLDKDNPSPDSQSVGSASTNGAAGFKLQSLLPGEYLLNVSAPGSAGASQFVTVGGHAATVTIQVKKGANLTVHVIDGQGSPAANMNVTLYHFETYGGGYPQFQNDGSNVPVDAKGAAIFTGLSAGPYCVSATPRNSNMEGKTQVIIVSPGKDVNLTLKLDAVHELKVRVLNALGKPIKSATVKAFWMPGQNRYPNWNEAAGGQTDAQGLVTIKAPHAAGSYIFNATTPTGDVFSRLVTMTPAITTVTLKPGDRF